MKPDWKYAPAQAKWLAMDGDGWWWWHVDKPDWNPKTDQWSVPKNATGDAVSASNWPHESGDIDWDDAKSTLEPRP